MNEQLKTTLPLGIGRNFQSNVPFYYNYLNERIPLQVLGGYAFLQKPLSSKIISALFFLFMQSLFIFTVLLAVSTVIIAYDQKAVLGQSLFTFGTLCGGMGVTLVRYLVDKNLKDALSTLRKGVYIYNEEMDMDYLYIKNRRVKKIKFILSFTTWMFSSCGVMYILVFPILKYFTVEVDPDKPITNPFLPIPLYVPFDTSEPLGFGLMFFFNVVTLSCMYASFASHLQIYITLSELLTAEYEVLNFSIDNILKRAYMELVRNSYSTGESPYSQSNYDNPDFQNSLYLCLRRNIIHHHAILRLRSVMGIYLEGTNTVGMLLFAILMASSIITLIEDPMNNIVLSLTLGATTLGYMPMCWFGEEITNMSLLTSLSFYYTPWPDCSERFKVLLKIAITNTFRPVVLQASALNVSISLETFAEVGLPIVLGIYVECMCLLKTRYPI